MKHGVLLVLLAAMTGTACSGRTLTRERAASLITALDGFKRDAHFTIQIGVPLQPGFRWFEPGRARTRTAESVRDGAWLDPTRDA